MDYVVGSVAALVSGNVTPNRPKFMKKALTPIKHQPSPNVTPKSELVDDRSIFLSPTLQKKKAIVKKSPKRIFENPDLDVTNDGEGNLKSPKADKVKKHLKEDLEADSSVSSPKTPKNKNFKVNEHTNTSKSETEEMTLENSKTQNESTPKKKKRKQIPTSQDSADVTMAAGDISDNTLNNSNDENNSSLVNPISSKKKNKLLNLSSPKKVRLEQNQSDVQSSDSKESQSNDTLKGINSSENNLPFKSPKKKNKVKDDSNDEQKSHINLTESSEIKSKENKKKSKTQSETVENEYNNNKEINVSNNSVDSENIQNLKNKNKKQKKKSKSQSTKIEETETNIDQENEETKEDSNQNISQKRKTCVNPNAITNKDTDSEHDSDNDIESENEQNNKEVLDTGPTEASSDEEETVPKKQEKVQKNKEVTVNTEEEVKRTLFVGNVPFSSKCKKELKKIFSKYGQIDTVRIRTVPVKDGRMTPKLAVIKNELHPDRSTVNVYIKFRDASSVNEALVENGTLLNNHHLRVTRSDCTGSEHDPKCSVFVGNLPFALEDETLLQKFQQCGEIVSVRIIRDRKTNAGKGFGYVNFKSKDAVELALALSDEDLTIKNRILRVKRCTQMTHKQKPQQDNRRGMFQGNYGRGNVQGRNQFGNRAENKQVGRAGRNDRKADGAMRRLLNKRKNQEAGDDGPPHKRERNINQPIKKTRKEFVGMTAEKRKKNKFNKGQKKKKALSEILTK